MHIDNRFLIAFVFLLLGLLLITGRKGFSDRLLELYRRIGIDAPAEQYSRQFGFVGTLLILFGFLLATGLIDIL
ncbi:MAG: hypothetical protein ABFS45_13670 [Pseudomonadota bacterium]